MSYATTSRRLADGVRRALLRLDIHTRVSPGRKAGYRDSWHVRVTGTENLATFLTLVGCHGARGACIPRLLETLATIEPDPESRAVATSDVFWDEVAEIVPLGPMPVFDATVEDTHNFLADGVVAHNSLEQDSDVVLFIYRDELYNPESPDRGTAEIVVAKHRNGPTGTTRLAFLDHYTRFANMARV